MVITNIHARARYEEAHAEGLAKGVTQGVAQGKRELLNRFLKRRFPDEAAGAEPLYAEATLEELDRYFDRALEAQTLDEVFKA